VKVASPFAGWSHLAPFLPSGSRVRMGLIGATSFLGSVAESGVLVIITVTADSLIRGVSEITIGPVTVSRSQSVLIAVGLVIARLVFTTLSSHMSSRFAAGAMLTAQQQLTDSYLSASYVARSSRRSGDLAAVLVNHGRFTGDLANGLTLVAASICALVAFGGTSIAVNPLATLGIALIGGLLILALRPLRQMSKRAADSFSGSARDISTSVTELESVQREIQVFAVEREFADDLDQQLVGGAERYRRLRFLSAAVPQIFQAAMLGAAVLSLLLVVNNPGDADLASIGAVVLLLVRSMSAAQQLVMANQRVLEFGAFAEGLNTLITSFRDSTPDHGTERPDRLTPLIVKDVRFTYDGEEDVFEDLDLELHRGELIGLVGPSGAGKSTLVELLLRLREPTAGRIEFGGHDARQIAGARFGHGVAFVPQQANLITGTIAQNVAFHREIPEERIVEAIRSAGLEQEIERLPQGMHSRLGPDDRSLSGGQRQRLTIARALAGDPEVVILDEPTSALDAASENAVRSTLEQLRHERIVIIVAHRYSTLRSCSRILVLRGGRVECDATPADLAERSDFFKAMIGEESVS